MNVAPSLSSDGDCPASVQSTWVTGVIVLITSYGDDANRAQAELLGASAVFDKPIEPDELRAQLRDALAE